MNTIGFDRQKYIALQSQHIKERRAQFGGRLYLEMGGKLFDDMHASRVLPGFTPDNKILMLESICLLYTSPSPRDQRGSRMPSSA